MEPSQVVVIPGADTAVIPRVDVAPRSGLVRARMTDLDGSELYVGWIPSGARVVMRGARVFTHHRDDEWRQIRVVQLGENGEPL